MIRTKPNKPTKKVVQGTAIYPRNYEFSHSFYASFHPFMFDSLFEQMLTEKYSHIKLETGLKVMCKMNKLKLLLVIKSNANCISVLQKMHLSFCNVLGTAWRH